MTAREYFVRKRLGLSTTLSRLLFACSCEHPCEVGVGERPPPGVGRLVPRGRCAILEAMLSRASRITVALALLICLICPLVETFDNWDHTIQTGNDTEYSLVVLALGVAYSYARLFFKSRLRGFVAKSVFARCALKSFLSIPSGFTFLLFGATSSLPFPLPV